MKTTEWLKQNYSEFLIHCKNTHRRIEFFEEMLNKFAQERTKDMYPKEFVEWAINHKELLIKFGGIDKLFIYWKDNIK